MVLQEQWRPPVVMPLDEAIAYREDRRDKGLKLVCLYGKYNREIRWKLNQYFDGSGYWTEITPCKTEAEARDVAINILREMKVNDEVIKAAKQLKCVLDPDKVNEFRQSRVRNLTERKDKLAQELQKCEQDLTAAKSEIQGDK